uniref:Uncharacterized protein n=1 Tax=Arundo donax TaxID=35708 RepID=A0A0A9BSL1_ARUDO
MGLKAQMTKFSFYKSYGIFMQHVPVLGSWSAILI